MVVVYFLNVNTDIVLNEYWALISSLHSRKNIDSHLAGEDFFFLVLDNFTVSKECSDFKTGLYFRYNYELVIFVSL